MTLHQKVSHLVGQWQGLDATERTARRDQLVCDIIAMVASESLPTNAASAALIRSALDASLAGKATAA